MPCAMVVLQLTEQKRPQSRVHPPLSIVQHFLGLRIRRRGRQVFSREILVPLLLIRVLRALYARQCPSLSIRFDSPQAILTLTFIFLQFYLFVIGLF